MNLRLHKLITLYLQDDRSAINRSQYATRQTHKRNLDRISELVGGERVAAIKGRTLLRWHSEWSNEYTISMAHAFMTQLRQVTRFGDDVLDDSDCRRLRDILSFCRFEVPKPRTEALTAEQAKLFRKAAHKYGHPSIALAQAFQFDVRLFQKDVIGELVPKDEPGAGLPHSKGMKWIRGLVWSEIDDQLMLRHATNKGTREVDLKQAPMVMEELSLLAQHDPGPKSGAIIICETTGRPWRTGEFRRKWRRIADQAGIPKTIQNRDTR